MKHRISRKTRLTAGAVSLVMLGAGLAPAAQAAPIPTGQIGPVVDHGAPIQGVANMQHASFGVEDGRQVTYMASNRGGGQSGWVTLSVVDYISKELVSSRVLPGVTGIERVHTAADGNVYFVGMMTGKNALLQYSPVTKRVKELATFAAYPRQITSDENSNVYVGAHLSPANSTLITYRPATGAVDYLPLTSAPTAAGAVYRDGYVYVSLESGSSRYLAKLDAATGVTTEIPGTTLGARVVTMANVGQWIAVLDGASIRFFNPETELWAQKDGAEFTVPGVFFGESDERNGKIVVTSDNEFAVIDGSSETDVEVVSTEIGFGASTIRGTKWAGDTGTSAFYTVQGSGHVSHFDIATGKQTNVNPLQQHTSHTLSGLGISPSGNIVAAATTDSKGVLFNPATGKSTERPGLPAFEQSVLVGATNYLVTTQGNVAKVAVEGAGAGETVYTPASGAQVVEIVAGATGPIILVASGQGGTAVLYNEIANQSREVSGFAPGFVPASATTLGDLSYIIGTLPNGDVELYAVSESEALVVRTAKLDVPGTTIKAVSALTAHDGSLWAVVNDNLVELDPVSGTTKSNLGFATETGSTDPADTSNAQWYGTSLYIQDEQAIVRFDAESKSLEPVLPASQGALSWQIAGGEDYAKIVFISDFSTSNLRSVEIPFDPSAGGSNPGEVDPIETVMPGVEFGTETAVGIPVYAPAIVDVAFGELNGRKVGYTATSSDGSLLNVIDVESNTRIADASMPSVIQAWKLEIAPNGNVYVAAIGRDQSGTQRGELWIYDPVTKDIKMAGVVPGASSAWSMVIDEDSNAYIGTYKTGEVVRYDAKTGVFRNYGQVEGQEYVRSIEYHDGFIYAGTGSTGHVVKINAQTGARERISDPLLAIFDVTELPWAYDMQKVDNWLLVNFTGDLSATAFYNLDTQEWSEVALTKDAVSGTPTLNGNPGFTQLAPKDGKVYLTYNGNVAEVDLSTDTPAFTMTDVPFGIGMRGQTWADLSELGHEGEWLVTGSRQGSLRAMNFDTKKVVTLPVVVRSDSGTPLHTVGKNSEGNLYFVTYPAGTGAEYNTSTGTFQNFPAEQAESMLTVGDTTYFGIYPGGHIEQVTKNDLGRPVTKRILTLGEGQDRPYYMIEHLGKILIGSIPDYGNLKGALSIYDPATGDLKVETNIVENQSVIGLAARGNTVWGSTTIHGGLGSEVVASEAKLFKYDLATGTKTGEYSLNLPGGQKPKLIGALSFGPDGNLWGTADGYVFVLNPDTMEMVEAKNIYPEVTRYGMWRPMSFEWFNGLLYINAASRITVINPENFEHKTLTSPSEEIARFVIAPISDELNQLDEESAKEKDAFGLYFFGKGKEDTLRVIPLHIAKEETGGGDTGGGDTGGGDTGGGDTGGGDTGGGDTGGGDTGGGDTGGGDTGGGDTGGGDTGGGDTGGGDTGGSDNTGADSDNEETGGSKNDKEMPKTGTNVVMPVIGTLLLLLVGGALVGRRMRAQD